MKVSRTGATRAVAVTPDDLTDLTDGATRGLFVGGAGNIAVIMADGSTVTFTGITAGIVHHLSVSRVLATGTTATNIVALY